MSDKEEINHPWERYYAAQGRERVEQMRVTRGGAALPSARKSAAHPRAANPIVPPATPVPASETSPAAEAEPKVASGTTKIDWNEVPLVELIDAAAQQRTEVETEARRVHDAVSLLRVLSIGLAAVIAIVFAFELVQALANDRPADARLSAEAERVGAAMLRQYAAPGQSIALASARAEFVEAPEKGRANFHVLVTLELRAPLYAPADSNGAQAYLQLQRALADAQQRVLASPVLRAQPTLLSPPTMPALIAQTHRRGERLTIRVPLEAQRRGFSWALVAHPEQRRVLSPLFVGETIDRQPRPHLVFGAAASRDEVRRLQAEARAFILAVQRAAAGAGGPSPL
ncbi:MAG: hypothetical protein HYV96_19420 [Opitutae bacterium]|nr:hypothetical protein [Opitutae bacterium]